MEVGSSMASRLRVVRNVAAGVAVAVLAVGLSACGSSSSTSAAVVAKHAGAANEATDTGCTPVVMVVRHGEDQAAPGGPDVLSPVGVKHANLYPKLFKDYLAESQPVGPGGAEVKVCPIGKIIAINPVKNAQNSSPGTNPYKTIEPLAKSLGLTIQTKDPDGVSYSTVYNWDKVARLDTLLMNGSPTPTSTVIAWDKQGLNPSQDDLDNKTINGKKLKDYGFTPLLTALPANATAIVGSGAYYTPQRTDFYVFALQDKDTGKFAYAEDYKQQFSDDGGQTWYDTTALGSNNNPNDVRLKLK